VANLTLSLDDEILQKAREAALREHTSVNALVRDYLTRYVDAKSRRLEAIDAIDKLARRNKSRSTEAWSRDELHRRQG
jgi:plasmid stability protein